GGAASARVGAGASRRSAGSRGGRCTRRLRGGRSGGSSGLRVVGPPRGGGGRTGGSGQAEAAGWCLAQYGQKSRPSRLRTQPSRLASRRPSLAVRADGTVELSHGWPQPSQKTNARRKAVTVGSCRGG